jgi:hypothetical protein
METGSIVATYAHFVGPEIKQASESEPRAAELVLTIHASSRVFVSDSK